MKSWVLRSESLRNLFNDMYVLESPALKFDPNKEEAIRDQKGRCYITFRSDLDKNIFYEVVGEVEYWDAGMIFFESITINCAIEQEGGYRKICLLHDNIIYEMTPIMMQELIAYLTIIINESARKKANKFMNAHLADIKIDDSEIESLRDEINNKLLVAKESSDVQFFISIHEEHAIEDRLINAIGRPIKDVIYNCDVKA